MHVHLARNDPLPTEALHVEGSHVQAFSLQWNACSHSWGVQQDVESHVHQIPPSSLIISLKFGGKIKREVALALPLALRQHANIF